MDVLAGFHRISSHVDLRWYEVECYLCVKLWFDLATGVLREKPQD